MENKPSLDALHQRSSAGSTSLLDRIQSSQTRPLAESQALMDRIVSSSLEEATKPSTMAALLGANFVSRFTRIGVLDTGSLLLGKVRPLPAFLLRGGSYTAALAGESAAFVGIERGFARWKGQPSPQSFQKEWLRASITLGSLKLFGGLTQGGNMIVQHLAMDSGLVAAENLASLVGIVDEPQRSLAQQLVMAEAATWQLKGTMALAHGLSPRLLPMERSLDFYLKNLKKGFFEKTPSLDIQKRIESKPLGLMIASSMTCLGCGIQSPSRSDLLFLTIVAASGLGGYFLGLRSARKSKKLIDQFHSLETKTLQDLIKVTQDTLRVSRQDIENACHAALYYGAPPKGVHLKSSRVFKHIAVNILGLPPVQRRGGIPISVFHRIPNPENLNETFSSITGMPLAYADRIRVWSLQHLEIDQRIAIKAHQEQRIEMLSQKIHEKFGFPIEQAQELVQLILREPPSDPKEQKGKLFENEFPILYSDDGSYDFHMRMNRQAANWILSEAGYSKDTDQMLLLKEVVTQLCAECRLPIPSYSMSPLQPNSLDMADNKMEWRTNFTDHDWQAVYRLRDAVWGPWRLPWEE